MIIGLTSTGYQPEPQLERWLLEAANGDARAIAALYEATRRAVYGVALSVLRDAQDAQDVMQDTYIRIYTSGGQYQPGGKPMAWLCTVARNLALSRLRARKKTATLPEEDWAQFAAENPAVTPEDRLVLRAAMQGLSEEERQIVALHTAAGLKHREIAQMLEMPLPTVLSKYHRALNKLKNLLTEEERHEKTGSGTKAQQRI